MVWRPPTRQRPEPKKHDHVGHMIFGTETARCDSCGQSWRLHTVEDEQGRVRFGSWKFEIEMDDW